MAIPKLNPVSQQSSVVLPATGSTTDVSSACPLGMYTGSFDFLSGAADQVAYTYQKLGGDILDIEVTSGSVYANYEEACLEYSYIVNTHQAKNILGDVLGQATASFDHNGVMKGGDALSGSQIELKYPKFDLRYPKRVGPATAQYAGFGGTKPYYSASIDLETGVQDYDLQSLISSSAAVSDSGYPYALQVGNKRITIERVFYKTPQSMWRFFGYYGGLNVVGNGSIYGYGQYTDDSTFEIVPVWQNKMQAMAYEDHLYTRLSHYSYEIHNNNIRIYPEPDADIVNKLWVNFTIDNQENAWDDQDIQETGVDGINNMNTLPFTNIPYDSINAIGKQWIRRFALALTKETLGQVRSKFATIPIPGESVNLNGSDLLSQAKDEQQTLREELKTVLDEMTYAKIAEQEAALMTSVNTTNKYVPLFIYQG
tara:strand:- start:1842 stop:3119 length:1278 start_codon:yes stop_codon:yes gene_type:complete